MRPYFIKAAFQRLFILFPCQAIAFQEKDWSISKFFLSNSDFEKHN